MARAEGLALAPWGVLAEGRFRTDEEERRRQESGEKGRTFLRDWKRNETEVQVSRKLEEIAKTFGVKSITAIAIAYLMHVGAITYGDFKAVSYIMFRKRPTFFL